MKRAGRTCSVPGCGRPVLVRVRHEGAMKYVEDHDLCQRHWRDQRNRERSEELDQHEAAR